MRGLDGCEVRQCVCCLLVVCFVIENEGTCDVHDFLWAYLVSDVMKDA